MTYFEAHKRNTPDTLPLHPKNTIHQSLNTSVALSVAGSQLTPLCLRVLYFALDSSGLVKIAFW